MISEIRDALNRCYAPPKALDGPNGAELLDEAKKIIIGAWQASEGQPEDNLKRIAALWTTYLSRRAYQEITPGDVTIMMFLMNPARLTESPERHDAAVDIVGYAALAAALAAARRREPL